MSTQDLDSLKEEIRIVKAWTKEMAKRADRIELEPALPGMEREWAEKNFEDMLTIHNQAYSIAMSSEWIFNKLDEIERETRRF